MTPWNFVIPLMNTIKIAPLTFGWWFIMRWFPIHLLILFLIGFGLGYCFKEKK
jgi:hypothetical protein